MIALLKSLRPSQWAKNLFVLAPLVFAHRADDPASLVLGGLAFLGFCFAASAVYLVNDIRDREEDRNHPLKRHRPIASGAVSVPTAAATAVVLVGLAVACSAYLGWGYATILLVYLGINALYSMGLKRVVILDVMVIAVGFVLRVMAGGAALEEEVSTWLLLCTILLALFLAFSKRRHEITLLEGSAADQRSVLSQYSPTFLDQMINVVTASSVIAYSLYAIDPSTAERFHSESLVYTIPLVLFGIFRYLYLIYQRPGRRNPTEQILSDLPFLANLAVWGLVVLAIVYWP